jgi:hypothetical protein
MVYEAQASVSRRRHDQHGTRPRSSTANARLHHAYGGEESRLLQVSIFSTLQNSLGKVDFSTVLLDVMSIADEVDSQLKQAVLGFTTPMAAMSTH